MLLTIEAQKCLLLESNIVTSPGEKDAVPNYQPSFLRLRPNAEARLAACAPALVLVLSALIAACAPTPGTASPLEMDTYTVQPGDTLSGIAVRFGATVDTIVALNVSEYPAISDPRKLAAGWRIKVPKQHGQVPEAAVQPAVPPVREASGGYFDDGAALDIIHQTNDERAKAGLAPLALDERLMEIARRRAVEIVSDYSHAGLADDCEACGENIFGRYTVESPVAVWMNSDGHRAGILYSDYIRIGVGVYVAGGKRWAVQNFE